MLMHGEIKLIFELLLKKIYWVNNHSLKFDEGLNIHGSKCYLIPLFILWLKIDSPEFILSKNWWRNSNTWTYNKW